MLLNVRQIRGDTSDHATRLCVKYAESSLQEEAPETYGICRVMISKDIPCEAIKGQGATTGVTAQNMYSWESAELGGISDGNINQNEGFPNLYLCIARDGCEGRDSDTGEEVIPALKNLMLTRDKPECPKMMRDGGMRIWQFGSADGDFNQGMTSGGDVHLCEERAIAGQR